ncbi:unnamed protein product [Victoria cruziana]
MLLPLLPLAGFRWFSLVHSMHFRHSLIFSGDSDGRYSRLCVEKMEGMRLLSAPFLLQWIEDEGYILQAKTQKKNRSLDGFIQHRAPLDFGLDLARIWPKQRRIQIQRMISGSNKGSKGESLSQHKHRGFWQQHNKAKVEWISKTEGMNQGRILSLVLSVY